MNVIVSLVWVTEWGGGGGVRGVFSYIIDKHAHSIKNFISKKIYYIEVHMQMIGHLHCHIANGKLLNSVSDTFVNIV